MPLTKYRVCHCTLGLQDPRACNGCGHWTGTIDYTLEGQLPKTTKIIEKFDKDGNLIERTVEY